MKLTLKDKAFLERLKFLLERKELSIQRVPGGLVLRKNYGDRIESHFGMTRQGVRWRFQHLFSEAYISAYETIYLIESHFGVSLRKEAFEVVRERVAIRQKVLDARQKPSRRV